MTKNKLKQFDIWQVDLNPTKDSEQRGVRPCVLLQTNAAGDFGRTIIVAPLSTKKIEKIYPFEVKIEKSKTNSLPETSKLKFDQIRVIDKSRLRVKVGSLETKYYDSLFYALDVIFDISRNFRDN